MPVTGWTNISMKDEEVAEIVALGEWLVGDTGIKITPPASIRAMVKKLQAIKKDEEK